MGIEADGVNRFALGFIVNHDIQTTAVDGVILSVDIDNGEVAVMVNTAFSVNGMRADLCIIDNGGFLCTKLLKDDLAAVNSGT